MFPVVRVVSRVLTSPSAEAGEPSRLSFALRSPPRGPPLRVRPPTMPRCLPDPEGPCSRPQRGSCSFLLDLSQWRSTLRSFPLVSSCAASTVRFSRAPDPRPDPGRTRLGCRVWSVVRPYGSGHRGRCLLAVAPGFLSPRFRPAHALGVCGRDSAVRSTSRLSSADESVAFAGCFHSTPARCSLGLRPSKACSHDKGIIGRSTGTSVGAPFPCAASESRLVCEAVVSWVVGACAGRGPTPLANQRGCMSVRP